MFRVKESIMCNMLSNERETAGSRNEITVQDSKSDLTSSKLLTNSRTSCALQESQESV